MKADAVAARSSAEEAAAEAAAQADRARAAEARAAAVEAAEMAARAALDALRAKRFAPPPPIELPDLASSLPPAPTALTDAERLQALLQRCKTGSGSGASGANPHPLRHLHACVDSLKLEVKALHEQLQPQTSLPETATTGLQVI